jgi:hypothetical protein
MADPNLDRQIKQLARKLGNIKRIEVPRANAAALNGIGRRSRTRIVSGVAKETRIPQKEIRRKTYLARATAKNQQAKLTGYARPVAAASLLSKGQRANKIGTGTNRRGVSARGYSWPGAFLQRGNNDNVHVFRRSGKDRYPIEVIKIDINKPFQRVMRVVPKRLMKSDYGRLLRHELDFRIRKYTNRL